MALHGYEPQLKRLNQKLETLKKIERRIDARIKKMALEQKQLGEEIDQLAIELNNRGV